MRAARSASTRLEEVGGPQAQRLQYDFITLEAYRRGPTGGGSPGPYLAEAWATAPHVHYDIDPLIDRATERTQDQASGNAIVTTFASYDENDNVTRLVDPLRRTFNYSYDHYDRLRSATYQDDESTPYYRPQKVDIDINDATNVTTVTETKVDEDGTTITDTTTEERDLIFDRLIHSTQRGIPVTYDYYRNGNRRSVSTPSGATSYTYDARGRIASTTVNGSPTSYQYYADGRIKVASLGNGTTTSYDYHPDHRIREISHDFASTTRKLHYDYDKNGNTTLATDKTFVGGTESGPPDATVFDEYDAADRLVQYRQDGNTTRYGYERYNRHTETVTGVKPAVKTFDYDPLSERLKKVTDTVANTTVTYDSDDNGNIRTRETQPANTSDTFTYDVLNQLKRVTRGPPSASAPAVLGRYDYDSAGRRVRQADTERGSVTSTYDGISVLEEAIAGTPGVAHNHYDGGSLLASSQGGQDTYFHQDNLGSTSNQSDATATPSSDYRYDPFGGVRQQPQGLASTSTISFTGQQRDEKTGLYYYGARFYDPAVGRFLTADTWPGGATQPASQNKFLYAYSNPARFVDPTGHEPCPGGYHHGGSPKNNPDNVSLHEGDGPCVKDETSGGGSGQGSTPPAMAAPTASKKRSAASSSRPVASRHVYTNDDPEIGPPVPRQTYNQADLDLWNAGNPHMNEAERFASYEEAAARAASQLAPAAATLGGGTLAFAGGFLHGLAGGLATSVGIGFAEGAVAAFFVTAAGFVAPVVGVTMLGVGIWALCDNDFALARQIGGSVANVGSSLWNVATGGEWIASNEDLSMVGGIAGGLASGTMAKPATALGKTAGNWSGLQTKAAFQAAKPFAQQLIADQRGALVIGGKLPRVGSGASAEGAARVGVDTSVIARTGLPFETSVESGARTTVRVATDYSLVNGRIVHNSRAAYTGPLAHLDGTFEPASGNLHIDFYQVAGVMRRGKPGVGAELIARAMEGIGAANVRSVSGDLGAVNKQVFFALRDIGKTEFEAAAGTPLGRTLAHLGMRPTRVHIPENSLPEVVFGF